MVLAYKQTQRSRNRIQSPEINLHLYSKLIFDRRTSTYNGLKIVYSINGVGKIGQKHAGK